jgi:hypothetical protein
MHEICDYMKPGVVFSYTRKGCFAGSGIFSASKRYDKVGQQWHTFFPRDLWTNTLTFLVILRQNSMGIAPSIQEIDSRGIKWNNTDTNRCQKGRPNYFFLFLLTKTYICCEKKTHLYRMCCPGSAILEKRNHIGEIVWLYKWTFLPIDYQI